MKGTCGTCEYGLFKSMILKAPGTCVRYPPTCFLVQVSDGTGPPQPVPYSDYPPVQRHHVCGEFKPKLEGKP